MLGLRTLTTRSLAAALSLALIACVGCSDVSPIALTSPSVSSDSADQAIIPAKHEASLTANQTQLALAEGNSPSASEGKTTGDWPMWGGSIDRNMVNATTGIDTSFLPPSEEHPQGVNHVWTAELGSQSYGNPVVADGRIYVGTNNGAEYRPEQVGDRGVVLCFNEEDGKFLWQLTREKLPAGRVNDWPLQGICSTASVTDGKVYIVTNRAELMCVDADGFYDGTNDGPFKEEKLAEKKDADIIWVLDMINELGVFPHNLATSSPVVLDDNVYVITSNGVDEAHVKIPAPRAPSFLCVNKDTGKLVWESNQPFNDILHGQWSSPSIGEVNGKKQIYFPGGDGWLYAFTPEGDGEGGGEIIWKFDMNPKDSVWILGRGTRNNVIATPVFVDNSVIVAVGQDPEHGYGVGHIYRIDATKTGDVSPKISDGNAGWKKNPNSGQIWHFGGIDEDGSVTGRKGEMIFRRTISTVAVKDGLVIAADLTGFLHCLDFETGKRYWEYDMFAACWGSPMVVDGHIFIGDEDGELTMLPFSKELPPEDQLVVKEFDSSLYSTPTIANGRMYISDRSKLYCFKLK